MASIINAIINLINNPITEIKEYYTSKNKINSVGDALEMYIKDLFSDAFNLSDEEKLEKYDKIFSYTGNKNNPPDIILKNGDAIEVKKIESRNSSLALNSSYPKAKLYSNSSMITEACRNCEKWEEKDIIYVVGSCKNNKLNSLIFVYGEDYAAENKIYEKIKSKIKSGINAIDCLEFAETNEIGRVNRVDPLGITYFRIRGMWGIENPLKVFDYVYKIDDEKEFNLMCVINDEKWEKFSKVEIEKLKTFVNLTKNSQIQNIQIKNPTNPCKLKNAKLITFKI